MACKTCGKQYHVCSACGFSGDESYMWDYCSETCFDASPKGQARQSADAALWNFLKTLSDEQLKAIESYEIDLSVRVAVELDNRKRSSRENT
jgi:hypothetical protein